MSNLSNFVKEANRVSAWYWKQVDKYDRLVADSFNRGDGEEVKDPIFEGPGSIFGLDYYDGGDDMDYIHSCILGFNEYDPKPVIDYIKNFRNKGYLTNYSSTEWKNNVYHLGDLYDKLSDGEKKNLWKSFPDYFDEDDSYDEVEKEIYESIYPDSKRANATEAASVFRLDKLLGSIEDKLDQDTVYSASRGSHTITARREGSSKEVTFSFNVKPCFTVEDSLGETVFISDSMDKVIDQAIKFIKEDLR